MNILHVSTDYYSDSLWLVKLCAVYRTPYFIYRTPNTCLFMSFIVCRKADGQHSYPIMNLKWYICHVLLNHLSSVIWTIISQSPIISKGNVAANVEF